MDGAVALKNHSESRVRESKFTPERIQQIVNLVERGKSRDEIAELVGVTPGTLQVKCSKLGISLRRRVPNIGTGLLRRKPSHPNGGNNGVASCESDVADTPLKNEEALNLGAEALRADNQNISNRQGSTQDKPDHSAGTLRIGMYYKGQQRAIELHMSPETLAKLTFEAEFREMRVTELVAKIILQVAEKDLFDQVLEGPRASYAGNHP